jgi:alkylation response protein AidB-like acyl-CoA dehydrogenase
MDFNLNEDQIEIARQAKRFFEKECPIEYVRAMFEDERGFADEIWNKMAEMGWMGMRIPEDYWGIGLETIDLCVLLIEMGRAVFPGPYFSTVVLAAEGIMEAADEGQKETHLTKLASGEIRGTLALTEASSGGDPLFFEMEARPKGEGLVLSGTKLFVPDAHVSDLILCAAKTPQMRGHSEGVTLLMVDPKTQGVHITQLKTMDGTRKQCAVEFRDVEVGPESVLGTPGEGMAPLKRIVQRAQVGLCAECVGGSEKAMELAVEYAKIRYQFGQPIGGFQAIKHRCADMLVAVEGARSLLYWASWAQDHGDEREAALSASVAKAFCSEAFKNITAWGIQTLGGVGFTWEHDMHLYFKRAKANEMALGDPVYHREEVARLLQS